jgi:hypothetical protein
LALCSIRMQNFCDTRDTLCGLIVRGDAWG